MGAKVARFSVLAVSAGVALALASIAAGGRNTCLGQEATIIGTSGNDELVGTVGDDVIVAHGGNDTIRAGEGNDLVCARAGDDRIWGGLNRDKILGDDRIFDAGGPDFIWGSDGDDLINAEKGGRDVIRAGDGVDVVRAGSSADRIFGGQTMTACLPVVVRRSLGRDGARLSSVGLPSTRCTCAGTAIPSTAVPDQTGIDYRFSRVAATVDVEAGTGSVAGGTHVDVFSGPRVSVGGSLFCRHAPRPFRP